MWRSKKDYGMEATAQLLKYAILLRVGDSLLFLVSKATTIWPKQLTALTTTPPRE